jgi:hypothetical protein
MVTEPRHGAIEKPAFLPACKPHPAQLHRADVWPEPAPERPHRRCLTLQCVSLAGPLLRPVELRSAESLIPLIQCVLPSRLTLAHPLIPGSILAVRSPLCSPVLLRLVSLPLPEGIVNPSLLLLRSKLLRPVALIDVELTLPLAELLPPLGILREIVVDSTLILLRPLIAGLIHLQLPVGIVQRPLLLCRLPLCASLSLHYW